MRFDGELTCVAARSRVGAAVRVRRGRLAGGGRRSRRAAARSRAGRRLGLARRGGGTDPRAGLRARGRGAEDEATGSAAMRLAAQLGRAIEIRQGRGSVIHARPLADGRVEIGGRVVLEEVRPYPPAGAGDAGRAADVGVDRRGGELMPPATGVVIRMRCLGVKIRRSRPSGYGPAALASRSYGGSRIELRRCGSRRKRTMRCGRWSSSRPRAARRQAPAKGEVIAAAQAIPMRFLENILGELRVHGLVQSRRGSRRRLLARARRRTRSRSPRSSARSRARWRPCAARRRRDRVPRRLRSRCARSGWRCGRTSARCSRR